MDINTIITSGAVTTLVLILERIARSIIKANSERTGYDRKREAKMEERISKLEKKIEETERDKDDAIQENNQLKSQLREVIYKVTVVLHKLRNIEAFKQIEQDVIELERELQATHKSN